MNILGICDDVSHGTRLMAFSISRSKISCITSPWKQFWQWQTWFRFFFSEPKFWLDIYRDVSENQLQISLSSLNFGRDYCISILSCKKFYENKFHLEYLFLNVTFPPDTWCSIPQLISFCGERERVGHQLLNRKSLSIVST